MFPTYAIQMADGSLQIMQILGGGTPDSEIAKWDATSRANVVRWSSIDPSTIPQSRAFRDAWTLSGGQVVHDMVRARVIHRARLKAQRGPLMLALRNAYQRADQSGNATLKANAAAALTALRNAAADASIDTAGTVADLGAVTLASIAPSAVTLANAETALEAS